MSGCPTAQDLRDFLDDGLESSARSELVEHVEVCPSCQHALEQLCRAPETLSAQPSSYAEIGLRVPQLLDSRQKRGSTAFDEPTAQTIPSEIADSANGELPRVAGFEQLQELGRGGMGVVYRAYQKALRRSVAIKMILSGPYANPKELTRFRREAMALARLDHPNIVQVYEIGTHQGRPFFSMEYVEGGSLEKRLLGQPCAPRSSAQFIKQVARGVQAAHAAGIIHRDLKPGNVLLKPHSGHSSGTSPEAAFHPDEWTPKISDFGLAKELNASLALTGTGLAMGTPQYMAPEQALNQEVTPSCDIYSLGAILYQMLTGRPPYTGTMPLEVLHQMMMHDPVPVSWQVASVPRDLNTICLKCLEKEPHKRYTSAAAMADDLQRFLKNQPIHARPATITERLVKWAQRNPTVAALSLAICVVALFGLGGILWQLQHVIHARNALQVSERTSRMQAAALAFTKGQELAERGEVDKGLHWMLSGLREAPEDAIDFRRMARTNLYAWSTRAHQLDQMLVHPGIVQTLAIAPGGHILLVGCRDGYVYRWDLESGQQLGEPLGPHPSIVEALGFSPDGRYVVTGSGHLDSGLAAPTTMLRRWETATGKPAGPVVQCNRRIEYLTPCDPEARIVLEHNIFWPKEVGYLWDLERGTQLSQLPSVGIPFWLDATRKELWAYLPSESDLPVRYHRLELENLRWVDCSPKDIQRAVPQSLSAQGALLVAGTFMNQLKRIDFVSGRPVGEPLRHEDRLSQIAFRQDGRRIAAGDLSSLILWDTFTGRRTAELSHHGSLGRASFSDDGHYLAAGLSWRRTINPEADRTVRVFRSSRALSREPPGQRSEAPIQTVGAGPSITPIPIHGLHDEALFSPDGRTVAMVGTFDEDQHVQLWDLEQDRPLAVLGRATYRASQVAFSSDSSRFAFGGKEGVVQVYDVATGHPRSKKLLLSTTINAVAFSPDGRILAVGDFNDCVTLWEIASGEQIGAPIVLHDIIASLAFSPDGKVLGVGLVTARLAHTEFSLWDVEKRQPIAEPIRFERGRVRVHFTRQGHLLFAEHESGGHLVDASTGLSLARLVSATGCASATFSADGRWLATGGRNGVSQIWNASDPSQPKPTLLDAATQANVTAMAFAPDGTTLLVGYSDGTSRRWDMATARPLGPPWVQRGPLRAVCFSADGQYARSVTSFGHARSWQIPHPQEESEAAFGLRLALRTGLEMLDNRTLQALTPSRWHALREELRQTQGSADLPLVPVPDDKAWHRAELADAEEDEDVQGGLWHVSHLLKAEPENGRWWARRGYLHALQGKLDLAEQDYLQLARIEGPASDLVTARARIADCLGLERFILAKWYANRALAIAPNDWRLYADRGMARSRLPEYHETRVDKNEAIRHGADDFFVSQQLDLFASWGEWKDAESVAALARPQSPRNWVLWQRLLMVALKAGDHAEYIRQAKRWQDAFSENDLTKATFYEVINFAKGMSLGPGAMSNYTRLLARIEEVMRHNPETQPVTRHAYVQIYALVLCRAGQPERALQVLQQSLNDLKLQNATRDLLIQALAQQKLGRLVEARMNMQKAQPALRDPVIGSQWTLSRAEEEILLREIASLLASPSKN